MSLDYFYYKIFLSYNCKSNCKKASPSMSVGYRNFKEHLHTIPFPADQL